MVENIKLTAHELKRYLKVSIYLPNDYNNTDRDYNVIYILDGQLMFHSLNDNNKVFDLPSILDEANAKIVCIAIHSPDNNDWRLSEVCPYYKLDETLVDPSLSYNFLNYIINILHPLMLGRYRITDNAYLLGLKESAILPLYANYHNPFFQGVGLFSPKLDICENYLNDLDNNFDASKRLFLRSNNDNLVNELIDKLKSLGIDELNYELDNNNINEYDLLKKYIIDFYNFVNKR